MSHLRSEAGPSRHRVSAGGESYSGSPTMARQAWSWRVRYRRRNVPSPGSRKRWFLRTQSASRPRARGCASARPTRSSPSSVLSASFARCRTFPSRAPQRGDEVQQAGGTEEQAGRHELRGRQAAREPVRHVADREARGGRRLLGRPRVARHGSERTIGRREGARRVRGAREEEQREAGRVERVLAAPGTVLLLRGRGGARRPRRTSRAPRAAPGRRAPSRARRSTGSSGPSRVRRFAGARPRRPGPGRSSCRPRSPRRVARARAPGGDSSARPPRACRWRVPRAPTRGWRSTRRRPPSSNRARRGHATRPRRSRSRRPPGRRRATTPRRAGAWPRPRAAPRPRRRPARAPRTGCCCCPRRRGPSRPAFGA